MNNAIKITAPMIRPMVAIGLLLSSKPLASIRVSNIISNRFYAVLLRQPKLTPQTLNPVEKFLTLPIVK